MLNCQNKDPSSVRTTLTFFATPQNTPQTLVSIPWKPGNERGLENEDIRVELLAGVAVLFTYYADNLGQLFQP